MISLFQGFPVCSYLLLGLLVGMLGGTFGVGGGVLVVPALVLISGLPQKEAQGVSLGVMVPMALIAFLRYYFNPQLHIDWRIIVLIALTAIIGANIGATLINLVSNRLLQAGFAVLLILVAVQMLVKAIFPAQ